MNYGLYLSAAGVLTAMHRQDVAANNLANAHTVGFKRDLATFTQRQPESIEAPFPDERNELLDRLGGGVFVAPTHIDPSPGAVHTTGNPLDLAIDGKGFFVVRAGEGPSAATRLTRDGRLALAPDNRLITNAGHELLDADGQPIRLEPGLPVVIDSLGHIQQAGSTVARLALVDPGDATMLKHVGQGLYQAPPAVTDRPQTASGSIRQGLLEQSNIDPVREMLNMIEATRAVTLAGNVMKYHDLTMERAANVLGRVA
jgi:flagellar basal body rod protein FlgG